MVQYKYTLTQENVSIPAQNKIRLYGNKKFFNISRITANITRRRKSARKLNSIMYIAQLGIMFLMAAISFLNCCISDVIALQFHFKLQVG